MSTTSIVTLAVAAVAAVVALWVLGAYNRLVRHRNDAVQAFAKLREHLSRRHDLVKETADLAQSHANVPAADAEQRAPDLSNGSAAAPPASTMRLDTQAVIAAHQTACRATDAAGASPLKADRIAALDRAQVALTVELNRLTVAMSIDPALHGNADLKRMREALGRNGARAVFASQAFNEAARVYNRAARQAPTHVVAKVFGFGQAGMLSPSLGAKGSSRRRDAAGSATESATSAKPPVVITPAAGSVDEQQPAR